MTSNKLHIYEEETNLFWAPVVVVAAAGATFILSDMFFREVSAYWGFSQILALLLILLSFYGILKIAEPLYHFIFYLEDNLLTIEAKKGEHHIKTISLNAGEIDSLKFSPSEPRRAGEALFDFSTDYHLMWKPVSGDGYQRLLNLDSAHFVLKVDDIAKIIRFIRSANPDIFVPHEQASYFNL